jgi:rhodanese-related sulfurtransferase
MRNLPCLLLLLALTACSTPDPKTTGGAQVMSHKELTALARSTGDYLLLDVRGPAEYKAGHIPSAVNLPYTQIAQALPQLREWRDGTVVIYDESGKGSAVIARILLSEGFENVNVLEGHLKAWKKKGLPLQ